MVYLISEDILFSNGLIRVLSESGIQVLPIDVQDVCSKNFCSDDVFLLCNVSKEANRLLKDRLNTRRVIYFIEVSLRSLIIRLNNIGVISKKISKRDLVTVITGVLAGRIRITSSQYLSSQETKVMEMLMRENTIDYVARTMNISFKTVYAHKHKAMYKMGLSHLNSKFILIYERVFHIGE